MKQNIIVGIVSVIVGILYAIQSFNIPKATIGNPWAPIYFPLALGILMIILGFVLIIKEHFSKKVENKRKTVKNPHYIKIILGTIVLCVIYALIYNPFGFRISTLIFLGLLLMLVNGIRAWKLNMVITISFTLGIWYIFEKILKIRLP